MSGISSELMKPLSSAAPSVWLVVTVRLRMRGGGKDGLRGDRQLFVGVGFKAHVEGQLQGEARLEVRQFTHRGVAFAHAVGDERGRIAEAELDIRRDQADGLFEVMCF